MAFFVPSHQGGENMALTLSDRVWILAERLYVHAHDTDSFLNLLRGLDIDYPGEVYQWLKTIKEKYLFMSEENYAFADFMHSVPSYKYVPLLETVVFDSEVRKTQKDDWNYYGEYIKNWYPELLNLLNLGGVRVDAGTYKLEYQEKRKRNHHW